MNKLFIFLGCITIFFLGYTCARIRFDPQMRLLLHANGKLTFCELNEDDRLHLCPEERIAQPVFDGAIVLYKCSAKEFYMQIINLNSLAQSKLLAQLKVFPGKVKTECRMATGEIFHLQGTMVRND